MAMSKIIDKNTNTSNEILTQEIEQKNNKRFAFRHN